MILTAEQSLNKSRSQDEKIASAAKERVEVSYIKKIADEMRQKADDISSGFGKLKGNNFKMAIKLERKKRVADLRMFADKLVKDKV